jgi:hypothetical protein
VIAALLVLFVGFIVLPVILVASIGRGGPILWVGGIVLVFWLAEMAIERFRFGSRKQRMDANRCQGCGHQLIPVQERCPECDRAREHPLAGHAAAVAAATSASTARRRRPRFSLGPGPEIRDLHR